MPYSCPVPLENVRDILALGGGWMVHYAWVKALPAFFLLTAPALAYLSLLQINMHGGTAVAIEFTATAIMDIVEQSGTGFAFPSQTLYFKRDDGLDAGKTEAAETQVRKWRDE